MLNYGHKVYKCKNNTCKKNTCKNNTCIFFYTNKY
nr:MAG TPA: hypothetical protein [Caudoviricetes sp.]